MFLFSDRDGLYVITVYRTRLLYGERRKLRLQVEDFGCSLLVYTWLCMIFLFCFMMLPNVQYLRSKLKGWPSFAFVEGTKLQSPIWSPRRLRWILVLIFVHMLSPRVILFRFLPDALPQIDLVVESQVAILRFEIESYCLHEVRRRFLVWVGR